MINLDLSKVVTAEQKASEAEQALASGIRAEGRRRLSLLVANYTDLERETWKGQLEEARAMLAGGSSSLVDTLAAPRGLTSTQMAQLIVDKAEAFKAGSAAILAAQEALLNSDPIPADYRDDVHWP